MKPVMKTLLVMLSVTAISACGSHSKKKSGGDSDKKTTGTVPSNTGSSNSTVNKPAENPNVPAQAGVNPPVVSCSNDYQISGTANPFLAGAPDDTTIAYNEGRSIDTMAQDAPVLVVPKEQKCLEAGRSLYFQVSGTIAYDSVADVFSDADGKADMVKNHKPGSTYGLSDIKAPINSLIGVFLDDTPFASRPAAPDMIDFETVESRNFKSLSPKIGQIFFIGDGKDAGGLLQAFVVPKGTTRLYLAIMDEYEWNNNEGQLSGTIQWVKP